MLNAREKKARKRKVDNSQCRAKENGRFTWLKEDFSQSDAKWIGPGTRMKSNKDDKEWKPLMNFFWNIKPLRWTGWRVSMGSDVKIKKLHEKEKCSKRILSE